MWRSISPIKNKVGAGEYRSYQFALHSNSFAMNDAHTRESPFVRLGQVFLNDGFHIARMYRMQIKYIRDLDIYGIGKWIVRVYV